MFNCPLLCLFTYDSFEKDNVVKYLNENDHKSRRLISSRYLQQISSKAFARDSQKEVLNVIDSNVD